MTSLVPCRGGGLLADLGQGWPEPVRWPQVAQRPVAQLPHQTLPVRHLALGVVPLEDGDNLGEQGDKVGGLDVAVLLQLGDEAHERGGVGGVLGAQLLELSAEEGEGELAGPELEGGRIAHQDLQLVQKMWRRHRSWQRSHLHISESVSAKAPETGSGNIVSMILKKSTSSLAAAALETADMTRRKERGVTGIPCWEEVEHSSFEAKIASIRSRSDAEHRDCK